MGWCVLSKATIEFPKTAKQELVDEVYAKMEKVSEFYNLGKHYSKKYGGQITFEMSGNKGISYEPIEKIKKFVLEKLEGKNKKGLMITANEYVEGDDGFYYEYEEGEENE